MSVGGWCCRGPDSGPVSLGPARRSHRPKVNFLVLDGAPQALDKDIVSPGALAVHADTDIAVLECFGEILTRKLAALVDVANLRSVIGLNRFVQCGNAETRIQRVGNSPGQRSARILV